MGSHRNSSGDARTVVPGQAVTYHEQGPLDVAANYTRSLAHRDTLRAYLITRQEDLRVQPSDPQRDAEIALLEGWIRWLRGAI